MLLLKNPKAYFNYEVLEKYVAGVVLKGYEVKALREKKTSFEGSYIDIIDGIPTLLNLHIGKYSKQSGVFNEVLAKRPKTLLLNKKEIESLSRELNEKGKTAVPLAFLLLNGRIKLEFAVVKGKKKYEKKVVAKERQIKKDLEILRKEMGLRG